jgi:hypothetical protein
MAAMVALVSSSVASAAPKLKTFGTGDVEVTGQRSATIENDIGEFGGVFVGSKKQGGKSLSSVTFSFTSRGDVQGGAPRFSLPIDTDGVRTTAEGHAFIDAAGCGATVGDNPTNEATLVSTQNPACHVNFLGVDYANWDAFAAANPTFATARANTPFIIADAEAAPGATAGGLYVVTDIFLGN